tara:strand:+ start:7046 stop:7729 length:684 start_codon:yes stop_codon:yes gene_type:complete
LGSPYAWKEKEALETLEIPYIEMKVDLIKEEFGNVPSAGDVMIPGRNMIIASVISGLLPDVIWISAVKGESHQWSTDKNVHFFQMMTAMCSYVHSKDVDKMVVETPFEDMSKLEIVGWALDNGYSREEILATSSCLDGALTKGKNCGNCIVCMRRKGIFAYYDMTEKYDQDPFTSPRGVNALAPLQKAYREKDFSHYSMDRIDEVRLGVPALFKDVVSARDNRAGAQ